jgi:putative phosphoribosyl transferase
MVAAGAGAVFDDRRAAGRALGEALAEGGEAFDLVLGIPRGGVIVAAEVADALDAELDVGLAGKLGAPGNPELALGAVGPDGNASLDVELAARLGATPAWVERAVGAVRAELDRRLAAYRGDRPPVHVAGRRVVVVDDGVATGRTAAAVGAWLAGAGAARTVLAAPVGPPDAAGRLRPPFDAVILLAAPARFRAVGEHYRRFGQTSDDEVVAALAERRQP